MDLTIGLLIPFLGTTIGSAMVFLMKNKINKKIEKLLLGFASGVMIAASVWSLLIPSIEMAEEQGIIAWIPASIGFMIGILFLQYTDYLVKKIKNKKNQTIENTHKKITMMILAVTLHNIPEGMAVGVVYAGITSGEATMTLAGALALSIGIAIQNFPEGAIISMPLRAQGVSKKKAFLYGVLSGVVEPLGALVTIALASMVVPVLPYFLSFAAGAMIYVVVEELIPEAVEGEHSNIGTIMFAIGFAIMMVLDVALG